MPDYSAMSDEEFDDILRRLALEYGLNYFLDMPEIYDLVREELNNDVLCEWERLHSESQEEEENDDA